MSCDKLVYDLSQEVEGSPNVFIRKDWLNILDNQNQNYQSNQSIIDTSQLSNSNKYLAYREAYLVVPFVINQILANAGNINPIISDYSIGLKNWFGTLIHSFTLDYNGTTIIQQTPFCNIWNSFKLLTTLSWADVATQGATIGFYPDTSDSFSFSNLESAHGTGTANNANTNLAYCQTSFIGVNAGTTINAIGGEGGNFGLQKRISYINFNPFATPFEAIADYNTRGVSSGSLNQLWVSRITQNAVGAVPVAYKQICVMATIYLKHVHSFFNMVPLLKGAFMKMTMNLNNSDCQVTNAGGAQDTMVLASTTVPVGGVQPLMIPSMATGLLNPQIRAAGTTITTSLSIGAKNLSQLTRTAAGAVALQDSPLSSSIYLYVPAYTFNPPFEKAYLSSPVKQIKYTDIYQYNVSGIGSGAQFNNLITNGIANIKSVLLIPFYSVLDTGAGGTGLTNPASNPPTQVSNPVYQSPFDPAGAGCTSPLVQFGNFNVQISGQNAIYNMERYSFEQFNNQLYGQNAVNGGLTDGLTSGLINYYDFKNSYCYYYVNVERMLPVEQSVPKSVQIIGTNLSTQRIDIMVFVEYGVEIQLDLLTGARV